MAGFAADFSKWWKSALPIGRLFDRSRDQAAVSTANDDLKIDNLVKNQRVTLQLNDDQFLIRKLSSQRLRASYARSAMEFDLAAKTPFQLKDVYLFGPFANGNGLEYAIVKRAVIDHIVKLFADKKPREIWFQFGDKSKRAEFLSEDTKRKRSTSKKFASLGYVVLLGAVLATATHAHIRNSAAIRTTEAQIDLLQTEVRAVRTLMAERQAKVLNLQALRQMNNSAPAVSTIWEEMTRALPDSAYLTDFSFRDDRLSVAGFAQQAASILPALEGAELFEGVEFTGPVVNVPGQSRQRFTLSMAVSR